MFSKQEYFWKPTFISFTVCWRQQKWRHIYIRKTIIGKRDVLIAEYQDLLRQNYKYQDLFAGRRPIKMEIVHIVNNNSTYTVLLYCVYFQTVVFIFLIILIILKTKNNQIYFLPYS